MQRKLEQRPNYRQQKPPLAPISLYPAELVFVLSSNTREPLVETCRIVNTSSKLQHISIATFKNPHFKLLDRRDYQLVLVPGLEKRIRIQFTPLSDSEQKEYRETIHFTVNDKPLALGLNLVAKYKKPSLSLLKSLDFGRFLLQKTKDAALPIKSESDETIKVQLQFEEESLLRTDMPSITLNPFAKGSFKIFASPLSVGIFKQEIKVTAAFVNDESKCIDYSVIVTGEAIARELLLSGIELFEHSAYIDLGDLFQGQRMFCPISLLNKVPHSIHWSISSNQELVPLVGDAIISKKAKSRYEDLLLSAQPSHGEVARNGTNEVIFGFESMNSSNGKLKLPVRLDSSNGCHECTPIDLMFGISVHQLEYYSNVTEIDFGVVSMPGSTSSTLSWKPEPVEKSFKIKNCHQILPINIRIDKMAHYKVTPSDIQIKPGQIQQFKVVFKPNQIGDFSLNLPVKVFVYEKLFDVKTNKVRDGDTAIVLDTSSILCKASCLPIVPEARLLPSKKPILQPLGPPLASSRSTFHQVLNIYKSLPAELNVETLPDEIAKSMNERRKVLDNRHFYNRYIKDKWKTKQLMLRATLGDLQSLKSIPNASLNQARLVDQLTGLYEPEPFEIESKSDTSSRKQSDISSLLQKLQMAPENMINIKHTFGSHQAIQAQTSTDAIRGVDLSKIFVSANTIDFGSVSMHSENFLYLNILNASHNPITINGIHADSDAYEIWPKELSLQKNAIGSIFIRLQSHAAETLESKLTYLINDRHKFKVSLLANIVKLDAQISKSKLNLTLSASKQPHEVLYAEEKISISNPGNSPVAFKWIIPNFKQEHPTLPLNSIDVTPAEAFIAGKSSINVQIRHTAGLAQQIQYELVLNVIDPNNQEVIKSISLPIEVEQSKPSFTVSCKMNRNLVDFGQLPAFALDVTAKIYPMYLKSSYRNPSASTQTSIKSHNRSALGTEQIRIKNTGNYSLQYILMAPTETCISFSNPIGSIAAGKSMTVEIIATPDRDVIVNEHVQLFVIGYGKVKRISVKYESRTPQLHVKGWSEETSSTIIGCNSCHLFSLCNTGNIMSRVIINLCDQEEFKMELGNGVIDCLYFRKIDASEWFKKDGKKGHVYIIDVAAGETLPLCLYFSPKSQGPVTKNIQFQILGNASQEMAFKGYVISSPLSFSSTSIDFKTAILESFVEQSITLFAKEKLEWRIGEELDLPIKFNPSQGQLKAGESCNVQVVLNTDTIRKSFVSDIPLIVNYQDHTLTFTFTVSGSIMEPTIVFYPPQLMMPMVHSNQECVMNFLIGNYGCDRVELTYKLPQELLKEVSMDLTFPEGNILKVQGDYLVASIRFVALRPCCFSSVIEFRVRDRIYLLPVRGACDNTIYTLPFIDSSNEIVETSVQDKRIEIMRWKDGMIKSNLIHEIQPLNIDCNCMLDIFKRWLDFNSSSTATKFPYCLLESKSAGLKEIIKNFGGKVPTNAIDISEKAIGSTAFRKRNGTLRHAALVLDYLAELGAKTAIVPLELLLHKNEYCKLVADFKPNHKELAIYYEHIISNYSALSTRAWVWVLTQLCHCFVSVNIKPLLTSTRKIIDYTSKWELPTADSNLVRERDNTEWILLEWASKHYSIVFGERFKLRDLVDDFTNSVAFASLIISYIPIAKEWFQSFDFKAPHGRHERNATILIQVLEKIIGKLPIATDHLLNLMPLDSYFLLAYLYQILPKISQPIQVKFNVNLNKSQTQHVEIENVLQRSQYFCCKLLVNNTFFNIDQATIEIPAKSKTSIGIKCEPTFHRPCKAMLVVRPEIAALNNKHILCFELDAKVEENKCLKTISVEAVAYKVPGVDMHVEITNIFEFDACFSIEAIQPSDETNPSPFILLENSVTLRSNESSFVLIKFLPFVPGRHDCQLHFTSKVGEFYYTLQGNAQLPEPIERISLISPLKAYAEKVVRVHFFNNQREQALVYYSNYTKTKHRKANIEYNQYEVTSSSEYFSVPTTLNKKASSESERADYASMKISFSPLQAGVYQSKIVLKSAIDIKLYEVYAVSPQMEIAPELEISTKIGVSVTQEIPFTNESDKECVLMSHISGRCFSGPITITMKPFEKINFSLNFCAHTAGNYPGSIVLFAQGNRNVCKFKLNANAS